MYLPAFINSGPAAGALASPAAKAFSLVRPPAGAPLVLPSAASCVKALLQGSRPAPPRHEAAATQEPCPPPLYFLLCPCRSTWAPP